MGEFLRRVRKWAGVQADAYRAGEQRPLGGYVVAMSVYSGLVGLAGAAARATGRRAPDRVTPWDVALLGVATHKLSRLLAKDAVTSPLRAPFVRFEGASGEAEVQEEVREHGGTKHVLGEITTCPFCVGQWIATGLTVGWIFAPSATRLVSATFAGVAMSDALQLGYAALERVATGDN